MVDQTVTLSEFNNATNTAINKAKTDILQAHRDSRVTFELFIKPEIDLRHTIQLTSGRIQCKGKVVSITHSFNRATGVQAESSFVPPTRPVDNYVSSSGAISLGSHYGVDPTNHPEWNGHIANKWLKVYESGYTDWRKSNYPESFVVDTPAIGDSVRLTRTLTKSQTYNVSIPDNNLIWTTVGK